MKRIFIAIALLLLAAPSFAQNEKPKEPQYNINREYRSKVFEVHNRDPHDIANAVHLLGSGFQGAAIDVNSQLRTITVRDFPENIASIEEAIKRLDVPAAATTEASLRTWIVIASKTPIPNGQPLPEDLDPVVKELRTTLQYSHYALMAANVSRVSRGIQAENSGIAEATALGMTPKEQQPIVYSYRMREPMIVTNGDRAAVSSAGFRFTMRFPIDTGKGIQYQDVGFETPVTVRDKEKVVIGTTTMGDKAVIVVVTADITK
jgi:hypothetical protein